MPRSKATTTWSLLLLVIGLSTSACEIVPVPIGRIKADSYRYHGTVVTIRGTVSENRQLLGVKWFYLEDQSGRIAVMTDRPRPEVGRRLAVQGRVTTLAEYLERKDAVVGALAGAVIRAFGSERVVLDQDAVGG